MWGSEQAAALKEVFDSLDRNGIRWMVMRNYKGLPEHNPSKDVDIAIARKDWREARRFLYEALKKSGFSKVIRTDFQSILCHTFYKIERERIHTIKIDIFACYEWRGAEYICFERLYHAGESYKGMRIPDPVCDGVMLFLKPIVLGGKVREKYRGEFEPIFKARPEQCMNALREILGERMARMLFDMIKNRDYDGAPAMQKAIRRRIWMNAYKKTPYTTLKGCLYHFSVEIYRRILPTRNRILAVLGPDGIGKSTFVDMFAQTLEEIIPMEREHILVKHFRPTVLPNIKKLIKGKNYREEEEDFTHPHRAEPAGFISSLIRLGYYWADYLAGVPVIQLRARYHQQLIIFDRYFHDFLADPERSRIRLPYKIRKLFFVLVKKPEMTFVLLCDPQIIFTRKQELTVSEIEKCLSKYRKLTDGKHTVGLDASMSPVAVVHQAAVHMINIWGNDI